MSYLVKGKSIEVSTDKVAKEKESIGNFYSNDRYYTILNEYINKNLSRKSRTLGFIIKYLFKSSNFKHDPEIANKKSFGTTLVDLIGIGSLFGFIAMLVSVVGLSIGSMPSSIKGFQAFGEGFIKSLSGNIVMLVLAIVFFILGISWLIMYFKIRKKNSKLSLKDYVNKKISTILKLRFLIKTKSLASSVVKSKKKVECHCMELFEGQGGNGDRWLNLQLINLLCSIFPDFNLVFKFKELTDDEYNELKKIFDVDFKNIEIIKCK